MPLNVLAFDPKKPSLGRILAHSVAPPQSPASIKRCISRVEKTPALAHADLFADISCDTPLKERHISPSHGWPRSESGWANGHCSKSTTSANHWPNLSTWSVLLFNPCNPCNTFSWWVSSVQEIISVNSNHHFEKSLYNLFQWLIYSTHCIFPWVQKTISAAASSTKVVVIYQIYLSFSEHHPSSIQQNTSIPSIFPLVLNTTTQLARPESAPLCGTCTCYVVVSLRSLQVGVPSSLDKQLQERICSWCQCGLGRY